MIKPDPPLFLPLNRDPVLAIERSIEVLNYIVNRYPEVSCDFDCESFIFHDLAPALKELRMKWIRCNDKMPPHGKDVLAYQESTMRIGIGHWLQRDDGKMWTFSGKTMHESLHSNPNLSPTEFSHWMPLPESPE